MIEILVLAKTYNNLKNNILSQKMYTHAIYISFCLHYLLIGLPYWFWESG